MYNFYLRRKALDEQHVRRQNLATYTEPLEGSPVTEKFISEFAERFREEEEMNFYSKERAKYPDLKFHFENLVPSQVSYEEFWRRYEYRTDLNRIMEEMKSARMSQSSTEVAKKEIHSLRRKIFKRLNMNEDAENPNTSDSSEPDEAPLEEGNKQNARSNETDEDPVIEEIESASDSDYSDFDGLDIHVYPDRLESDDDVVVELDMNLSASEFDTEALDELGIEPQVYMYPDSIIEVKEGADPALKIQDIIHDDEYGSSLEFNSEYGSLGQIADPDCADEEVKQLDKVYTEDDIAYQDDAADDKADKCECACIIS